jgi:hypothetical protein
VARSRIRGFACCNELYEHRPVVEGFRALRATPGPEKIARESLAHLRTVWGHG